jgi:hypothetical protein
MTFGRCVRTLATVIALVTAACSTGPLPAGAVCDQAADCESTLSCLDIAQINGTTCTVVGKTCSITCSVDGDCATLGTNFRCFAGCGVDKVCGEVASP